MTMLTRTKKTITIVSTVLVSVLLAGGGVAKILKVPAIQNDFKRLGVGQYTQLLGFCEIIFLVLLLYPKTMKWGFLLLCSYLGGAMATHLSHGEGFLQPVIPLLFIYVNVYLRDKTIFIQTPGESLTEIRPGFK